MTVKILSSSLRCASLAAAVVSAVALSAGCSDPGDPSATGGATGSGGDAATGGTSSGGGSSDATVPSDTSQAGIEAFLAAESYKSAPWVGDAAPRPMDGSTSPHGIVRAYFNPTAITSREEGQNDYADDPGNATGSMSVKEMYDSGGTLLGKAVMLRVLASGPSNTNPNDWIYYCSSSATTCASGETGPIYGAGQSKCAICHGGTFIAPLPAP